MNRLDEKFKALKKGCKKAFITFIMAGDPDIITTERLIERFYKIGVDIVELGIPFSDPLADGPTIQRSAERSFKNKITPKQVLDLVEKLRTKNRLEIPIVILTYYNIIFRFGLERFVKLAKTSGVDGIIVPDLPVEESLELRRYASKSDLFIIHLAAPTSPEDRIRMIDRSTRGFIYYVSLTGTTGARKTLPKGLLQNIKKIKKIVKNPLFVGFGISNPEQVREISEVADGAIIGSAIINVIEKYLGKKEIVDRVEGFVRALKSLKIYGAL